MEGYETIGRHKFVVFVPEIRTRIDCILHDPDSYAIGWNSREMVTRETFRISGSYLDAVRKVLAKRDVETPSSPDGTV